MIPNMYIYNMIKRNAENTLRLLAEQFKAVAVTGPRQSGKTTLVRQFFKEKPYVNLENPDERNYAIDDPRGFLSNYPDGAILDEVQRAPQLFSYLQQILDDNIQKGQFILTGSNNFLLQESISQSLAGRVGYLFLLPLCLPELSTITSTNELLFKGLYPELHSHKSDTQLFFANYIRTYVERDVRLIKNIGDLNTFERFLRLCAGRVGQLLNMSNLAADAGIDNKTVKSWLSVLETSFIIFRLQPYHESFNKRLVKMPKLYFTDTGLASALLGIEKYEQMATHPLRGSLFENLVVTEFLKYRYNQGKNNNLFFWRNNMGNEIDLIYHLSNRKIPIEIKSGQTISSDYLKGINYWQKLSGDDGGIVIYDGQHLQKRSNDTKIIPISELDQVFKRIEK